MPSISPVARGTILIFLAFVLLAVNTNAMSIRGFDFQIAPGMQGPLRDNIMVPETAEEAAEQENERLAYVYGRYWGQKHGSNMARRQLLTGLQGGAAADGLAEFQQVLAAQL